MAIDGRTVGRGQLRTVLASHEPGDEVAVTVTRGPRLLTRHVRLAVPRPAPRLVAAADAEADARDAFRRWCGAELHEVTR
ncbi:hypothetical protein [Longimonas sp.]|uniref:hypothetical protein n=1 Tax=Longimonas sp. TaxID=2039626 RepID=UPI003974B58B